MGSLVRKVTPTSASLLAGFACCLLCRHRHRASGFDESLVPVLNFNALDSVSAWWHACIGFRELPLRPFGMHFAERLERVEDISYVAKVTHSLYRGSFPGDDGVPYLRGLGVRTIINLNGHNDTKYMNQVKNNGMRYEFLPLKATSAPTQEQVARFFHIITDVSAYPIYVHCLFGVDRTGTMVALFRIREQGWRNVDALAEMIYFGDHGFSDMRNFVADFQP